MKLAEKYQQKVCRHLGKNYIQIMSRNTHSTISITKSSSNWSIIRKSKPKHKAPNLPNQTKPYFQNHTHTHIKFLILLEKGKCKIEIKNTQETQFVQREKPLNARIKTIGCPCQINNFTIINNGTRESSTSILKHVTNSQTKTKH